jgi:Xaa-Pro dipeptidase
MNKHRVTAVKNAMSAEGLTQMVVTDPISIFYLTGVMMEPWERLFALYLSVKGEDSLVINTLYTLDGDIGMRKLWFSDVQDGVAILSSCVQRGEPLGIDKNMPARFLLRLMELGSASGYINASHCVDGARACKDNEETELMKTASALNDRAIEALLPYIKTGVTELELSDRLLSIYKSLGADGPSFSPLIGFGANAAEGHHEPDGTVLKDGDCVLLDVGCKKDMYCADMTRTYFCGHAPDRLLAVYNTVKSAGDAARALVRPGVPLRDIDGAARNLITDAGYGPYFTHRLGHFIGLGVHEAGDVSQASDLVASPGMVFSVEPGVYLPGEGGVRIEDLVLITETGCEVLNHVSRELTVLPS